MLSRKYYKQIAEAIKQSNLPPNEHNLLVNKLCYEFSKDNPSFSSTRFVDASQPGIQSTLKFNDDFQKHIDGIQEG